MIRQAQPADAPIIARLIIAAMGELAAKFVNGTQPDDALPLFEYFAGLPANQYSYQHTLVYEDETNVCGMISGYDGATVAVLRQPFIKHIRQHYFMIPEPENETQAGEFYIDCLSVLPAHQGKGIGRQLIAALAKKAKVAGHTTMGLLVNKGNTKAEKLYTGLGFLKVAEKELLGTYNYHLQLSLR